ncbi:hypothetical protein ES705_16408 [subsurface metagenome]
MSEVEYIINNSFFIGREKEIDHFKIRLNQLNNRKILYIHGESGIGKSTLLEKFRQICKDEKVPVAKIDIQMEKGIFSILQSISKQFKNLGFKTKEYAKCCDKGIKLINKLWSDKNVPSSVIKFLASKFVSIGTTILPEIFVPGSSSLILSTVGEGVVNSLKDENIFGKSLDFITNKISTLFPVHEVMFLLNPSEELTESIVKDINNYIKRKPIVIMFDTFEMIGSLEAWIYDFVIKLEDYAIVIIAGRRDELDEVGFDRWRRLGYYSLELNIFDETDVKKYLVEKRGINDNRIVNEILKFADRSPLALATAADAFKRFGVESFTSIKTKDEVIERLISQILNEADPNIKKIIRACSVVRWFNEDILSEVIGIDNTSEIYNELKSLTFIKRHINGLSLHDKIRDYLIENLKYRSPAKYREINLKAANFYKEESKKAQSFEDRQKLTIEWLYHLMQFDKTEGVKLYLNIFAEADILHQRMFVWQLADEIKMFSLDSIDKDLQIKVLDRLGVVVSHQGKTNDAINYLEKCWDIYQNMNDKNEFTEAGILRSLGEAYRTNGKYDKAIEFFLKSLKIRQNLTLQDEDNIDKAKDAYWPWANNEEDLKTCMLDGKSKVLLAIAKTYLWQHRYDQGLKHAKEALEIAKILGDDFRIGQSYRRIADIYFKMSQFEEALDNCKKAEKLLLNTVGENDIATGWLFRKIGEIYQQIDELNKGEEYFIRAINIFKNSKTTSDLGISATLVLLCSLYSSKGIDIDELAKEAEQYDYYEQISLLKSIQGDVQFDKSQYSESYKLYAQSCLNALHYSRYLLDEIIDHIIIQINELIKSNKKKEALGLCKYLINFWRDYKDEENKARQNDIGDGEPQQQLINRIQSEIAKINQ